MSTGSSELTYRTSSELGSIYGRMTFDENVDNTEATGHGGWEKGVSGKTVQLLDVTGKVVAVTTTELSR